MNSGPSPARRGRLLVIDDDPSVLLALRRMLSRQHDVVAHQDPREALALLQAGERFDLVVCDLMMPGVTGMQIHADLLGRDAEQADRMVFLSGGAYTPSATEFLARVPNERLDKPFDIDELRALVARRVT